MTKITDLMHCGGSYCRRSQQAAFYADSQGIAPRRLLEAFY
ncbi:hypothetical protein ACFOGG_12660 [Brenneria rubrifaciens]